MINQFGKLLGLITAILLIAIIPFLFLGEAFEADVAKWFQKDWSAPERFGLMVALLAVDIALPIPSSAVITYGGAVLGFLPGMIAGWLGLTQGALLGFWVARLAGAPLVQKLVSANDRELLSRLNAQHSTWTVVISRPLPILAEAAILLLGSLRINLSQFILPLCVSNLVIASGYSAIGALTAETEWTTAVVIASMFLPIILTLLVRKLLQFKIESQERQRVSDSSH